MAKVPFLPPKLQPNINYSSLVKEIAEANRAIGELKGLMVNHVKLGLLI